MVFIQSIGIGFLSSAALIFLSKGLMNRLLHREQNIYEQRTEGDQTDV
ncbi:MAG: hypothetical protein LKI32_06820 [Lachnospiraceae bacterium]|jgi:hypothetical protein|nr:hypothetical protein [Clostridium sp. SY8519]MCI1654872.1 hypothetical protein [Lachnospiraceae bacterium]MCI1657252.1 hypothetical protein [Lachnospiraceae bacterium]MCI2195712.1 hypothetical protein [Lachnospiraceae bacterium]BAK48039.1 hypothetical protein CXIVA_20720 [Clostridium sp. SY8519]